jgi:hypothetical protein
VAVTDEDRRPAWRSTRQRRRPHAALAVLALWMAAACAPRHATTPVGDAPPRLVPGAAWRDAPALGHAADAARRNLRPGESLTFDGLRVSLDGVTLASADAAAPARDEVMLTLAAGGTRETRTLGEGEALAWNGYRIAVVGVYGPGELGAGFTAVEVATLVSLPAAVAASSEAGGAGMRLRIPHEIMRVTLHHIGSAQPLRPEDDPAQVLRNLQAWGARDRNWWDVPYHYLIDLDGRVFEGRDWRYMGETNTDYDPAGHFLISVIGNYELQEPTSAQLESIADLMAWALARFDVPAERIGGHYHFAGTSCPGQHLRRYLEDGTFRRMAESRLRDARR